MMMVNSRVAVSPGDGVLVRRASAVLFDATGQNADLVAAFDAADTDDAALTNLKRGIVNGDFGAAPLVAMRWHERLELLVFGDVEVQSSAPTVPMINGAASTAWVEHHLDAATFGELGEVGVWCGLPADPVTDLRLGITGCGGIKVTLSPSILPKDPTRSDKVMPQASPAAQPTAEQPVVEPEANRGLDEQTASDDVEQQSVVSEATPVTAEQAPIHVMTTDSAQVEPEPGVVATDEPIPTSVGADEPEPASHIDATHTDVPIDLTAPIGEPDLMLPAQKTRDPFAEEILAVAHETTPTTTPQEPHDSPAATDPDSSLIEQPVVGELVFPEGTIVRVDREIVLGRTPDVSQGSALPVTIQHSEVSRSHAQITVDGWAVLLTDLDSRNGTWVCPPGSSTPAQLRPGVPHFLEDGATVHLGGPEASFSYRLASTS